MLTFRPDFPNVREILRLPDGVDRLDAEGVALVRREVLELEGRGVGRHVDVLKDLGVALPVPLIIWDLIRVRQSAFEEQTEERTLGTQLSELT